LAFGFWLLAFGFWLLAFRSGEYPFAKAALNHLSALTAGYFFSWKKVTMGLSRDNGRQKAGY